MPDDPTTPALEMSQVPRQRQRHEQRLTMRVVVEQIRAELTVMKADTEAKLTQFVADLDNVRALALAQGERRSEELRHLVREVVKEEIAAQLEIKLKPVLDMLPALRVMVADHAKREAEEKEHEASMLRLIGVLRTLTTALETGWESVKPLLYALLGIFLTSKAQSISTWPQSVFWVSAGVMIVVSIAWPRMMARLRTALASTSERRKEQRQP